MPILAPSPLDFTTFPSLADPQFRLTVGGSVVDYKAALIEFDRLESYSHDGEASLEFHVLGESLAALPDPYLGKSILLEADYGSGYVVLFRGRCTRNPLPYAEMGWNRRYYCKGLAYLANRVPVTNPVDGTDSISFNLAPDDPNYNAALASRSVGYMLRYVLDTPTIGTALTGYGIGGYASSIGSNATATVTTGGVFTVTAGGSGYSSGSPPNAVFVGGGGTWTSITVTVTSGAVTALSVSGMSGYSSAPEVWISCLPVATLRSFALLTLVPQSQQIVQGERLFDSLKSLVHSTTRNHALHIDNDGTIKAYDLRSPGTTVTLTMDNATDRIDLPSLSLNRSIEDCYQRVVLRGGPDIRAALVGIRPPTGSSGVADNGLSESFGHDGLTTSQAKDLWSLADYTKPGEISGRATMFPTMGTGGTAGKVVSIAAGLKGYGYTVGATYNAIISAPSSGVTAAANSVADASGQLSSWTVTNQGSGYGTSTPTCTAPAPPGTNFDTGRITSITPGTSTSSITIDPDDNNKSWAANTFDQSSSGRKGVIFLLSDTAGSGITCKTSARVTANASLTAGGTCVLTVEGAIPTGYNSYELYATAGGSANVWTLYSLTSLAPFTGHIAQRFPFPVPYRFGDGSAITMTSVPCASVLYSSSGSPPFQSCPIAISIDGNAGTIRTVEPTVIPFGSHTNLTLGGSSTDGIPSDVQALLPIITGNLKATYPADVSGSPVYAGTSYTVEGKTETYTMTLPTWIDRANQTLMDTYAQEIHQSVCDAKLEGEVTLLRFYGSLIATFGQAITLQASYTTPWDTLVLPVLDCTLTWNNRGKGNKYTTSFRVSNSRDALAADYFVRPTTAGFTIGGQDSTGGAFGILTPGAR